MILAAISAGVPDVRTQKSQALYSQARLFCWLSSFMAMTPPSMLSCIQYSTERRGCNCPHRKSPNISVRAFLCFFLDKVRFMPYNGGILFETAKEE